MLILLCLLVAPVSLLPTEKEEGYFGLPVGSLKEPRFGITSDVYIADERTIVLDKFIQHSRDPGCASLMIGPARPSDTVNKVGPGVLLPFSDFDFSWEDDMIKRIRRRRSHDHHREKRSAVLLQKRFRGKTTTSTTTPLPETTLWTESPLAEDASYEVVEYIDEDDDGVQKITVKKIPLKKVQQLEPVHESLDFESLEETDENPSTIEIARASVFPTLVTDPAPSQPLFTTDPPMIIFNKKKTHASKLAAKKTKQHMEARRLTVEDTTKSILSTSKTTRKTIVTTTKPTSRFTKKPMRIITPRLITATPKTTITTTTTTTTTPPTTTIQTTQTSEASTTIVRYSTTKKRRPKLDDDFKSTKFSIPESSNSRLAFILTNNKTISEYKWIAIWDQCSNKSVPHIWLDGLDPPREEVVGSLTSLVDDLVSSGPVRILNCNTILIENLIIEPKRKGQGIFFYAGAGKVDDEIRQKRARIVGFDKNQPITSFSGDDVMVRLPIGTRTFDMDFISIFNEDTGETLAFIELPSVLVPPCAA